MVTVASQLHQAMSMSRTILSMFLSLSLVQNLRKCHMGMICNANWSKIGSREEYEINFLTLLVFFLPKSIFQEKCLVFGRRLAKWVDWLVKPGEEAI